MYAPIRCHNRYPGIRKAFRLGSAVVLLALTVVLSGEAARLTAPTGGEYVDTSTAAQTSAPLASLLVPGFRTEPPRVIYTQPQRAGRGLHFWPDGNIGLVPSGDRYLFFAANSVVPARTSGTLDDPAFIVESGRIPLVGTDSAYAYAAGGPIYRDPDSGMLLMFYHAERHFSGDGAHFYSELGLARSRDGGWSFQDLGIILTPNLPHDPAPPRTVEMAGAPFVVAEGHFYVYFRDALRTGADVNLAVARAPVDEVVRTALDGKRADWRKFHGGAFAEPGRGGRSTPLEIGNPLNRWMDVSYNAFLERFLAVIVETIPGNRTLLHLISSEDGLRWSPRATLQARDGELFYPSILDPGGDPLRTGETFYVYYTASANGVDRWRDAALERLAVTLSGELAEAQSDWGFDDDAQGWLPLNQIGTFEAADGRLIVDPTGGDPFLRSPDLGLSTERYARIEVRMRSAASGTGQFFFTSSAASGISERHSVRFPVQEGEAFRTYTVDMAGVPGWSGHLGYLRFDPIDVRARVEIDRIRLLPN